MSLYNEAKPNCEFGHFTENKKASYTLTASDKLRTPWYYIYQNRKILLYVDQNGPVKIQYQPPSGILLTKRELAEVQSKWQVWVSSPDFNNGVAVSNFNSPKLDCNIQNPVFTVEWTPTTAIYKSEYQTFDIITEIFLPFDKATVCMKTTVVNKSDEDKEFTVTPSILPYVNVPQMVAWDLPEWYLSTKMIKNGNALTFAGKMTSPDMIKENERSITFNVDYDSDAQVELDLSCFVGSGSFFAPQTVVENQPLSYVMKDANEVGFGGFQSVWSAKYKCKIKAGAQKTFTQVLTVQESRDYSEQENIEERAYFNQKEYEEKVVKTKDFYEKLFTARTIKTNNQLYDNFINNFTPLQMYWVCSLDRGWPSSMRGTRDASQDFIGILPIFPEWVKETIKELFEHQRTDGWFPRQISTVSRQAPHDMRYFSDGGAFLLELIHEYLTFTRDFDLLSERVWWLDSDEKDTVLEHIIRTVDFYLDQKNIGEHGLCKVWYGDWWDPMDKIGMDGIGETVSVTAQMILNIKNLADMLEHLCKIGVLDNKYLKIAKEYLMARDSFINAMREHAYNKKGFFNGYFNDNKKWLLSDCDPDGRERVYLVSNSWAIISGACTEQMEKSVIENIERQSYSDVGYYTSSKGFPEYIDKAGRKGNGNAPNPATYNHAQSFYVRACCMAGRADLAYKATRHILPIEECYHPVDKTFAPPYALANCYEASGKFKHRVTFQFLSGTVSYVLRNVYNYFFGITYGYDGLTIKPCIPKEFGDCQVEFEYLNKKFIIKRIKELDDNIVFKFNGTKWEKTKAVNAKRAEIFIADEDMVDVNVIEIS